MKGHQKRYLDFYICGLGSEVASKEMGWNIWVAQSLEPATLGLGAMDLSPAIGYRAYIK